MEKAVFVVTECNPFHNGHKALFDEIRRRFPDRGIVCVQSGNFVQRGEFAIADKYARARETVMGGADLVLEIIPPYSALSAEAFAAAAVHVALGTGLCETLAFGSEIPDENTLREIAARLADPAFEAALQERLSVHPEEGYPAARSALYEERFGACPALSLPNATLGVYYLMALAREDGCVNGLPLPRVQGPEITSASEIRGLLREGKAGVSGRFLPIYEVWRLFEKCAPLKAFPLDDTLLYLLRALPREEIASFYGMAPLADRACALAREVGSAEELFAGLKAAHLTDSRIRRSLLALLLRTPRGAENSLPPYTVLLAANERGRALLAGARLEPGGVKIITKPADALSDPDLVSAAEKAAFADSLYASAQGRPGAYFLRQGPVIL